MIARALKKPHSHWPLHRRHSQGSKVDPIPVADCAVDFAIIWFFEPVHIP